MSDFPPPRIASLVPSLTELLFALGLGPWVVARTGFCIHPAAAVAGVPKVGGTKDINHRKLQGLAPTHVLVNPDENRREDAEALATWVPHLLVSHPGGPQDNLALLDQMAAAFGPWIDTAALQRLRADLTAALDLPAAAPARRVLYLIWREPWMTVARDTYIARMLAATGWQTWPDVQGGATGAARYPVLRGDEPWLAAVDEVWLSSEPYRFTAADLPGAQELAPRARVRLVDGELVSWYGPRAALGLRYLHAMHAQS